jgi:hypothetical protein
MCPLGAEREGTDQREERRGIREDRYRVFRAGLK